MTIYPLPQRQNTCKSLSLKNNSQEHHTCFYKNTFSVARKNERLLKLRRRRFLVPVIDAANDPYHLDGENVKR